MKKINLLLWIIIFFSLISLIFAQDFSGKPEKDIPIQDPEKELKLGETLEYAVHWLGIYIGRITLKVESTVYLDNHDCFHIIAYARPNRVLRKLYDVEYTVHTYIDRQSLHTRHFEKIRRAGDKINREIIDFDYETKKVIYRTEGSSDFVDISSAKIRKEIEDRIPTSINILEKTQDLFSSFYYFRLLNLKAGQNYPVNIYYGQRNWTVNIKIEEVLLKDFYKKGSFAVFEAIMNSDLGEFILGKRKFVVYFTADSRRIPMEFRISTAMGPIHGIIQDLPK